jgi:phosphate transport system substrate-binding protein
MSLYLKKPSVALTRKVNFMKNSIQNRIIFKTILVMLVTFTPLHGDATCIEGVRTIKDGAVESTFRSSYTHDEGRMQAKKRVIKDAIVQASGSFGILTKSSYEDISRCVNTANESSCINKVLSITKEQGINLRLKITGIEYPINNENEICGKVTIVPLSSPKLDIKLKIHGSNTIGSELAPNLVRSFLISKKYSIISDKPIADLEREVRGRHIHTNQLITFEIKAHGSSTAFDETEQTDKVGLRQGYCDIGMASRRVKTDEGIGAMRSSDQEHVVALDGVAIIVNHNNPINNLSIATIRRIFLGQINDWEEIGYPGGGQIQRYTRDNQSGTFDCFKKSILDGQDLDQRLITMSFEDSIKLSESVANDPTGIGFIGLPYINETKALSIRFSDEGGKTIPPTQATIRTEDYPLARRLYFYLPPNPDQLAKQFVEFSLGDEQLEAVIRAGFVPVAFGDTICQEEETIEVDLLIEDQTIPELYKNLIRNAERCTTPINFRFKTNSFNLDSLGIRDIDRLSKKLRQLDNVSQMRLILVGFADPRGKSDHNLSLSRERTETIRLLLRDRGVLMPITTEGFGEEPSLLIDPRMNLENGEPNIDGLQKNRRVEVWLERRL